jgi:hypothetical protein
MNSASIASLRKRQKHAVACMFASWGQLDSNQRPRIMSLIRSDPPTCSNASKRPLSSDFTRSLFCAVVPVFRPLAAWPRPANTSWRRGLCLSAITDRVQGRGPMAKRGEQGRRITPCDRRRGRAGEEKRSGQGLVPDRLLYPETWVVTLDGQVSIGALIERAGVSWSAWVATGRRCTAPLAFASRRPAATGQRRLQHPARKTALQPGGLNVIRP